MRIANAAEGGIVKVDVAPVAGQAMAAIASDTTAVMNRTSLIPPQHAQLWASMCERCVSAVRPLLRQRRPGREARTETSGSTTKPESNRDGRTNGPPNGAGPRPDRTNLHRALSRDRAGPPP